VGADNGGKYIIAPGWRQGGEQGVIVNKDITGKEWWVKKKNPTSSAIEESRTFENIGTARGKRKRGNACV